MGKKDESKHLQKLESRLDELHELVKGLALEQKNSKRKDSFYPNPYFEKKSIKKWEDFFVDHSMSEVQKKQHKEGTAVSILGHSMNAIIIDILIKINEPLDRQQISAEIENIKKESSKIIQDKIHGGKDTINFWIKQLLDNEIINQLESRRPLKFEINHNHFFINFLNNNKKMQAVFDLSMLKLFNSEELEKTSNSYNTDILWNLHKKEFSESPERRFMEADVNSIPLEIITSDGWEQDNEIIEKVHPTEKVSNFYDFVSKILNDKKEKRIFPHHFELVRSLKEWRKIIAGKKPAYIIFNDKTLMEIVINLPISSKELLAISGIGETKMIQFGRELLRLLKNQRKKVKMEKKKLERRWHEYQLNE